MNSSAPVRNWILRHVEPQVREQFASRMRQMELSKGQVLHRQGEDVDTVYFPEGARRVNLRG